MGLKKPSTTDTPQEVHEEVAAETETAVTETEQVTETAQPVEETTADVPAEVKPAPAPAVQQQGNFENRMAEQGFGGLELGFGSFPTLRLMNEGVFADDDDVEYGTSFTCLVQSTRIKHLYKQAGNQDGDVYYSYDAHNLVKASDAGAATVDQLRQEFKEDGWDLEVKDYLEAVVIMQEPEEDYDGEMFLLSIPPASRNKFAGMVAGLELQGKNLRETPVICSVGKKRKAKRGGSVYFPWAFKAA